MHIRCGEQVTGIQFHRTQIYLSAPEFKVPETILFCCISYQHRMH